MTDPRKDCTTCFFRTMPDDVDWTKDPCETCVLVGGWGYWQQRTPEQYAADKAALEARHD